MNFDEFEDELGLYRGKLWRRDPAWQKRQRRNDVLVTIAMILLVATTYYFIAN